MKGIILAGGAGTRLNPITNTITKQLLPVYDKPMIYYPLSILMLAGIQEILIISTKEDLPKFQKLFGDGSYLGLSFSYIVQDRPNGIAEAFILGEEFIGNDSVCLILGDNIYYGQSLPELIKKSITTNKGATIFGYYVNDPERYGVIEFSSDGKPKGIIEKPKSFVSNYAVTGLYVYDNNVIDIAKQLKPSARGELEITDVNNAYLKNNTLNVKLLSRGVAWLDTGTFDSLLDAALFVQVIERRQGLKIACIEEIALKMGYIDHAAFSKLADTMKNNQYGKYLNRIK
ncbi:glucose-1-phosphate thymidylyltransferase RfbA [Candidatus Margulisiibacteriota bacterium]